MGCVFFVCQGDIYAPCGFLAISLSLSLHNLSTCKCKYRFSAAAGIPGQGNNKSQQPGYVSAFSRQGHRGAFGIGTLETWEGGERFFYENKQSLTPSERHRFCAERWRLKQRTQKDRQTKPTESTGGLFEKKKLPPTKSGRRQAPRPPHHTNKNAKPIHMNTTNQHGGVDDQKNIYIYM